MALENQTVSENFGLQNGKSPPPLERHPKLPQSVILPTTATEAVFLCLQLYREVRNLVEQFLLITDTSQKIHFSSKKMQR